MITNHNLLPINPCTSKYVRQCTYECRQFYSKLRTQTNEKNALADQNIFNNFSQCCSLIFSFLLIECKKCTGSHSLNISFKDCKSNMHESLHFNMKNTSISMHNVNISRKCSVEWLQKIELINWLNCSRCKQSNSQYHCICRIYYYTHSYAAG